jgi:hypothetical protein
MRSVVNALLKITECLRKQQNNNVCYDLWHVIYRQNVVDFLAK